jgi:type IV pilus assembly protein PilY1
MTVRLIYAVLFVLIHLQAIAKELPVGSADSVPANVLLMLDTSGSMAWTTNAVDANCATLSRPPECYPNLADSDTSNDLSRMEVAMSVIKDIVSNPVLNGRAHFGLLDWNSAISDGLSVAACNAFNPYYYGARSPYREKRCGEFLRVPISVSGASTIQNSVDQLLIGGATKLDVALRLARGYLYSADSPIKKSLSCQNNIVIIISDGNWEGAGVNDIVADFNSNQIQTFVIGFSSGASNTNNYNSLAKAGGTKAPYFASNADQLKAALLSAISSVTEAAQVEQQISPRGMLSQDSFQVSLTPQNQHQWRGYLKRQKIESNKLVTLWEAGDLLNKRSPESRRIWTASDQLEAGDNNFVSTSVSVLRGLMFESLQPQPSLAETNSLINFVRGADAYNEFAGSRWKLGDVYHSTPLLVGTPSASSSSSKVNTEAYFRKTHGYQAFKERYKSRREVVYAGANDGMLHAFDAATGQELWGFIPPPVLPKLRNMIGLTPSTTQSIYAVDGSPSVEDVYFDNEWHSILICGLGRGGSAYFAIDVTNPESPRHLYSFENDADNAKVHFWDSSGKRLSYPYTAVSPDRDFHKLGQAWSEPVFSLMYTQQGMRWVVSIGNGFHGLARLKDKAGLMILDVKDGSVIRSIDLEDNAIADFTNGVVAKLAKVIPDQSSGASFSGSLLYLTDLHSNLWRVNLTSQGGLFSLTKMLSADATLGNDRLSMNRLAAVNLDAKGELDILFGTGNLLNTNRVSDAIDNRLYAIKDLDFPVLDGKTSYPFRLEDDIKSQSLNTAACSLYEGRGWYLGTNSLKDGLGKAVGKNTRVLYAPIVFNGDVYLQVFQPSEANACGSGVTRQVVVSKCGTVFVSSQSVDGKASPFFIYRGELYLTDQKGNLYNESKEFRNEGFISSNVGKIFRKIRVH